MTTVKVLTGIYEGRTIVVLGTGPSAWPAMADERWRKALERHPIIAVNRAFDIGVRVKYQVSIDHIWASLLKTPAAQASNRSLIYLHQRWCKQHDVCPRSGLPLEDFLYVFRDKLSIHPEVWRYYRLVSPHAPFMRITTLSCANAAPYQAVPFVAAKVISPAKYDGLMTNGNSAIPAVHLACIMGAKRVLLLGVDMTEPDKRSRPWETGPAYYRAMTRAGFKKLAYAMCPKVQILNLNPDALLQEFQKVKSTEAGLAMLEE